MYSSLLFVCVCLLAGLLIKLLMGFETFYGDVAHDPAIIQLHFGVDPDRPSGFWIRDMKLVIAGEIIVHNQN